MKIELKEISGGKKDMTKNFTNYFNEFDKKFSKYKLIDTFIDIGITISGKLSKTDLFRDKKGNKSEEYYKWQFVYAMINSGLYSKDYIGTEIWIPKGSSKTPIKLDICVFKDNKWLKLYLDYWENGNVTSLNELKKLIIFVIEFKKNTKSADIKKTIENQVFEGMKLSTEDYVLGAYSDGKGKLLIFKKRKNILSRFDDKKNNYQLDGHLSLDNMSLEDNDKYLDLLSFDELINKIKIKHQKENRKLEDLDKLVKVDFDNILANLLKSMESIGLNNYNGYKILIELLAIKVYDEKFNEILNFYITEQEENSIKAGNYDENFLERIYNLFKKAKKEYKKVLSKTITEINKNSQGKFIGLKNNYMKLLMYTIKEFQDYNIVESSNGSFNQIIFHNFAKYFSKMEQNQFVTPIQIIDFLVYIINPKVDDTICDPCSGIADFLVMSHRYCKEGMSDEQLYGIDIDPDIIVLSQFNLILNGDGNANLEGGYDSLLYKFKEDSGMIKLDPKYNKNGNWDYFPNASDKLEKFSIVLTNPPFGKGRALEIGKQLTKSEAEMYELYNKYQQQGKSEKTKIDKGVLFLENAVRILDENGRMGIVLSNSIVSIDTWKFVREWLLDNLRIVALFDLPENIFGEAGVNTNLIVGYKPKNKDILKEDYEIFIKDIKNVGYEKKSKKRNVVFVDKFKFDMKTFERQKDKEGNYIINEDFTETLKEFKEWAKSQEKTIKDLFL